MEILLVISDEPALALALADTLPEYRIVPARAGDAAAALAADTRLIVAEKEHADIIASLGKDIPHLLIARPVRLREILYTIDERLQAQSRAADEEIGLAGGYRFSPRERLLVSADGAQRIMLTEKESDLCTILLGAEDIIQREQLLKEVWGYHEDVDTHTLETHIYRLRGKLRQMEAGYDIVSSPEGGYRLQLV